MARGDYPSAKQDQFMVRFPDGMRDRLRDAAENHGRSMNSEIIQRLSRSFDDEGREYLRIDLPPAAWNALMTDAGLHNQEMEERAVQLLEALFIGELEPFDEPRAYAKTLDRVAELESEHIDLGDRYSDLRERMDYDFILYFNKVTQLDQFANVILAEPKGVSDRVRAMAEQIADVTQAEIAMFKDRHKYAVYHQKRKEGALLESENAEGTAKGIDNVTYGEVEEYTRAELAELWDVPAAYLDTLVRLDVIHVRRTGNDDLDFTISKRAADRFLASGAGKRLIDDMKPLFQKRRDVEREVKGGGLAQ